MVQSDFGDVKLKLSVRYVGIGPDRGFYALVGHVLIVE
jgi:hypothetical protein